MTYSSPIRIGILGAAAIVPMALTNPAQAVHEAQILAIAARDPKRAYQVARKYHIPRVHQTYAALISDPDIDAIYNPLPNSLHAEWTIRALKAAPGKNILTDGSHQLVHTLLKHDLVDELHLLLYPIILGGGKKLFPEGVHTAFKLKEAVPYPSGVVGLHYVRA